MLAHQLGYKLPMKVISRMWGWEKIVEGMRVRRAEVMRGCECRLVMPRVLWRRAAYARSDSQASITARCPISSN